jgi:hypothetical protein
MFSALVLASFLPLLHSTQVVASANPIRRVVNMLQKMQTTITQEGKKEESLYNKFACYCTTGKGDLADSIKAAEVKIPEVSSAIEGSEGSKAGLDGELTQHKADRAAAEASVKEANALREKQAAAFAASSALHTSNIGAIGKAVAALEKGMAGSFLQTTTAKAVQTVIEAQVNMAEEDRQAVMSFLSGGTHARYTPQSGQITGILKQLGDSMTASLADETADENTAIADHAGLVAAKSKEIAAHTKAIEEKSIRVGETAVRIVEMKKDLADTQEALANDKTFLDQLEKGCDTKGGEWEERQNLRSQELLALAETIKFINNDDALELFKKAVPSGGASFMQLGESETRMRAQALKVLRAARGAATGPGLDFITLALQGKVGGFEKVTKMIDEMVDNLHKEQQGDDSKKEYCETSFDEADDKKKALSNTISDESAAIANAEETIATLSSEIKALTAGIAELDKSVADATDQRKQEHADFTEMMALDTQAKKLLGAAKNRLNQFYNPKLYIAPKRDISEKERVYETVVPVVPAFVQVASRTDDAVAPPPAPEVAFGGSKSQESNSVVAMIDLIVGDLDKEMTEGQTSETDAQKDYEATMADAKAKRASDSNAVAEKEGTKANLEAEAQAHNDEKDAATKELAAHSEYIAGLHAECDWLVEHHQVRKDARTSEVESLKNAKAVLAGADYSFVQVSRHAYLRGRA